MAAVNTLAYGAKRWTLLPPRDAVYSACDAHASGARKWHSAAGRPVCRPVCLPTAHLYPAGALPAREWHAAGGPAGLRGEGRTVVECVQRAGDVLYVPGG